jgi:hypothetical protein
VKADARPSECFTRHAARSIKNVGTNADVAGQKARSTGAFSHTNVNNATFGVVPKTEQNPSRSLQMALKIYF